MTSHTPLRRLRHLIRRRRGPVFALVLLAGLPGAAWAAMSVFDGAAVAKLADQLTKLQEQIAAITEVRDKVQEQIDAIGELGKVTLPGINLDKLGATIRRDLQCLKPDFSDLMPSIEIEDIEINSICGGAALYRDTLWVNPDSIRDINTWENRQAVIDRAVERRERIFSDTVNKGLAHADVATRDAEQTSAAIAEMKGALRGAVNSKQQLQAMGQGQIVIAETLAKQNQILAQMLKVQSAFAMMTVAPVEGRDAAVDALRGSAGQGGHTRP